MMSGLEINTTFVSYIKTSMYLTGMSNIRDVVPFPRTPKNAEF